MDMNQTSNISPSSSSASPSPAHISSDSPHGSPRRSARGQRSQSIPGNIEVLSPSSSSSSNSIDSPIGQRRKSVGAAPGPETLKKIIREIEADASAFTLCFFER